MEGTATLGGDMHVMIDLTTTLILSYRSVLRSLKLQRRLEQVEYLTSCELRSRLCQFYYREFLSQKYIWRNWRVAERLQGMPFWHLFAKTGSVE